MVWDGNDTVMFGISLQPFAKTNNVFQLIFRDYFLCIIAERQYDDDDILASAIKFVVWSFVCHHHFNIWLCSLWERPYACVLHSKIDLQPLFSHNIEQTMKQQCQWLNISIFTIYAFMSAQKSAIFWNHCIFALTNGLLY